MSAFFLVLVDFMLATRSLIERAWICSFLKNLSHVQATIPCVPADFFEWLHPAEISSLSSRNLAFHQARLSIWGFT
ncbi:MAG: hypothetical protein VX855_03935, partial [Verrucomicrobiota bacterium]|nr:hypothetical protein [Verrucomicrobiota bacterium]